MSTSPPSPTPSKPDTAAIRLQMRPYTEGGVLSKEGLRFVIRELCDYIDAQKVTVDQIREFVQGLRNTTCVYENELFGNKVLDFIDNGPPKPTAEEVLTKFWNVPDRQSYRLDPTYVAEASVMALREAGYLREDV